MLRAVTGGAHHALGKNAMLCLAMHLRYSTKDNRWHLFAGTRHIASFDRKSDGEEAGRERCNLEYVEGAEARLVVHRADGTVELQYAYTRPRTLFCPAVRMTLAGGPSCA